ncbi:MAG TPA: collagen-binding domain-containing protein, partial [Haliangiales bacterium]|nr:collagen-binding domain-containing protein [Haliangiales bacterium]
SFDSTDPQKSGTGGKYDANRSADKGDVATNLGIVDSINVGNADIRGHVSTGPGGSVAVGSNGAVGDENWVANKNGIEPGWVSDDANVDIPDATLPKDFSANPRTPSANPVEYPPGSGKIYDYVLSSGDYRIKDFKGAVLVVGAARVLVESSFNFSGADGISINSGANLQVYVAPASASLGGNGVQNQGNAMSFIYWGLNSNTTLSFGGNSTFTGVIYAPYADFKLGGSGGDNYDFVGASVSKTVTMTGHFHFHYDESLARLFPVKQFVVYSWSDINPNN